MAQLITEIDSAKANNKVSNLRNSLFNKQLLIIDAFGFEAMDDKTTSDFLVILEQRMGIRSLIIVDRFRSSNGTGNSVIQSRQTPSWIE